MAAYFSVKTGNGIVGMSNCPPGSLLLDPLLHVNFEYTERLFVALDRCLEGEKHTFGSVKVHDNPFGYDDGNRR